MRNSTDTSSKGSAFERHFSEPFEKVSLEQQNNVCSIIDPTIGWYQSTARTLHYPFLNMRHPIDPQLDPYTAALYKMVANYEDLVYCRRLPGSCSERLMYCAHALNHCLRARKLTVKNNEKERTLGVSDSLRDQGFHRARTLILVPTKEAARRVVHTFLGLMPKGSTVSHRRRFERDFGPQPGETDDAKRKGHKPSDYEDWFSCNTGDCFRIGIAFAKKAVKLYSAFVESDLILASPLGLKTIIDDEKEKEADMQYITASIELLIVDQAEMLLMQNWSNVQAIVSMLNQRPSKATFASASRIRLAYLAGYGRRYRQSLIFSAVSAPPITLLLGDCENFQGFNYVPPSPQFDGVYRSLLPEHARMPSLKTLGPLSKKARLEENAVPTDACSGEVKLDLISFTVSGQTSDLLKPTEDREQSSDELDGTSHKENVPDRFTSGQILLNVEPISNADHSHLSGRAVPIARLNAFKTRVLPRLRRGLDERVLVYVPDFYDLEELRLLLTSESLDFCCISEYTEETEEARFRTLFADGRIRILLLSERYFFFRRRKIRGAQTFIFYAPPTFPWFVNELLSARHFLPPENSDKPLVTRLTFIYFLPFDAPQIAAITGRVDL